mgnify:FL=1
MGQLDLLAKINGKNIILDFKTTNPKKIGKDRAGVYADHAFQVAGYAIAYEEMHTLMVHGGLVLWLNKQSPEFLPRPVTDFGAAKTGFLALREAYRHFKAIEFKQESGNSLVF